MSELKNLLQDVKTSLQDLENLLQKAKSIDQAQNDHSVLTREELQKYFDEITKMLERLPENLRLEESVQQRGEIKSLHLQMEDVRNRLEEYLGQVENVYEKNLQNLSEFIENLDRWRCTNIAESQLSSKIPNLNELLSNGRIYFENKNYDACLKLIKQALEVDPSNREAANLVVEAQKKLEDQRLEEELVITIENLKKEAMDQFDREQYRECEGTFKFLCELEPQNRTLQDYLELSRQKVQELEEAKQVSRTVDSAPDGETDPVELGARSKPAGEATLSNAVVTSGGPTVQENQAGFAPESCEDDILQESWEETNDPEAHPEPCGDDSQLETHRQTAKAKVVEEDLSSIANRKAKRLVAASLIGATLLLSLILGLWSVLRSGRNLNGSFDIQTVPEGAQVFINGELKGETRLHIEALAEGNYDLRIEKEGYMPLTQKFDIEKARHNWLSVRLEKIIIQSSKRDLQEAAKTLFDQGDLLEASQNCDLLLERDPQNRFALKLKDKIRKYYLQQSRSAMLKAQWEEARVALENTLKVSPQDAEASGQLKALRTKLRKPVVATDLAEAELKNKIQGMRRQISLAMNAANYFPPNSGNAVDLIKELIGLAPGDPFGKEKLDQIQQELVTQAERKLQARDFEGAKGLVRQLQVHFSESIKLRNLRDTLKVEESKQLEVQSSWMQKAESAMVAGRYVTPSNDNAYSHSNRILAIDPQNQKALSFRKESLSRAGAQAKEYIQKAKFDEAREIYSSLLQLSAYESRFPLAVSELKGEMEKLEFNAYPVVHDHSFGSCTGRLRFNAYVFSFVPSGSSADGFTGHPSEVTVAEPGDKLKVQFKNKTFRFEANLVKSKEENREKIKAIYQQLSALVAKAK